MNGGVQRCFHSFGVDGFLGYVNVVISWVNGSWWILFSCFQNGFGRIEFNEIFTWWLKG